MSGKNITFALAYLGDGSGTGGMVYNWHLAEAWSQKEHIRKCDVKKRFFQLGIAGPAWLLQYRHTLRNAEWLIQAASSGYHSELIIDISRKLYPHVKHLGIAHHPRWLENSKYLADEVRFYNKHDRILTISKHVKKLLIDAGIRCPIDILYPGYTSSNIDSLHFSKDLKILWNGHLLARKGALALLEALELLDPQLNWTAEFVAVSSPDAGFAAAFHEKFKKLQSLVGSRISYSDRLPLDEFQTRLDTAGIFCLPSLVEGYSIATVEAMARGCVPVLPSTDNFLELIGDSSYPGFYAPFNSEELAKCLTSILLSNVQKELCLEIINKRIKELPDWQSFESNAVQYLETLN